jgi:Raf kinase inhibitor-like YbhB/YbcL family protein
MALAIKSTAFAPNGAMSITYTCEGDDVSPALEWSGVPERAKSLALIVDDPDAPDPAAPKMVYVHWVLYDIPPSATSLPEGVKPAQLPKGAREGKNDFGKVGYGGPCPPIGRHRYFFKLYALDSVLGDLGQATKADVEAAMRGHVLEHAEVVGTYQGANGPARPRKR